MNRIDEHFINQKEKGRKSLIIYLTGGFPDAETTEALLPALAESGADLIELGVPFSDPIADGATIQKASEIALSRNINLKKILKLTENFKKKYEKTPLILFGALNPFYKYGYASLVKDARNAGADGFLAADLPPEEGEEFRVLCLDKEMSLVYLIAPTTPSARRKLIAEKSSGFIYYVSLKGVTGERSNMSADLYDQVASIKRITDKPVAVGFGVSKPEHVEHVAKCADGVIVGSAVIAEIMKHKNKKDIIKATSRLVSELAKPLKLR